MNIFHCRPGDQVAQPSRLPAMADQKASYPSHLKQPQPTQLPHNDKPLHNNNNDKIQHNISDKPLHNVNDKHLPNINDKTIHNPNDKPLLNSKTVHNIADKSVHNNNNDKPVHNINDKPFINQDESMAAVHSPTKLNNDSIFHRFSPPNQSRIPEPSSQPQNNQDPKTISNYDLNNLTQQNNLTSNTKTDLIYTNISQNGEPPTSSSTVAKEISHHPQVSESLYFSTISRTIQVSESLHTEKHFTNLIK